MIMTVFSIKTGHVVLYSLCLVAVIMIYTMVCHEFGAEHCSIGAFRSDRESVFFTGTKKPGMTKVPVLIDKIWDVEYLRHFKISSERINVLNQLSDSKVCPLQKENKKICRKYGFGPLRKSMSPPHLYYGVLYTHEIDILRMALYEMSDLIHSYTIVEANATFTGEPREMNFPKQASALFNASTSSGMGLHTKVVYHPWADPPGSRYIASEDSPSPNDPFYGREEAIRNSIIDAWRALGMRPTDLAIVSDTDEFLNRDFLTALKCCDVFPMFRDAPIIEKTVENITLANAAKVIQCKKNKYMARIAVYSGYLDCPQYAQYGNVSFRYPGIRHYW